MPAGEVMQVAADTGALPYDVPGVELGHHGDHCSFDAFIAKYELNDAALDRLALIVRAADCAAPQLAKGGGWPVGYFKRLVTQFQ